MFNLVGKTVFSKKFFSVFNPSDEYGKKLNYQLNKAIQDSSLNKENIYGVGFAIPGIFKNNEDEVIDFSPSLNFRNWSFEHIGRFCKYDYILDNDASFGSYCEAWFAKFEKNFAYLHIAGGVGGSIVFGSEQITGNNYSGEFGHMIIGPSSVDCKCGRNGCLETFISTNVLSQNLGISLNDFFVELSESQEYRIIFDSYLDNLCVGISNIHLALGLDVVIAGEIIEHLVPYEHLIQNKLSKLNILNEKKYFEFSELRKIDASSLGAALKVIALFVSDIGNYF